ncbi:MAG: OmpA family protein [Roseobacter sp.]
MIRAFLCFMLLLAPVGAVAQDIGTVNFDFDSATLDQDAKARLAEIAEKLNATPSYKPTLIVGFTDASGATSYNDNLGLRRARAVEQELERLGVDVNRIGSVNSRGERELLVSVAGPERLNRRVTVTLSDMLAACRSYRDINISPADVNAALQSDISDRYTEAQQFFDRLAGVRGNGAAFQMAGAAVEDCRIATSYELDALRKGEYAQKCLCNSARMRVAMQ